jgi:threonine dehydrogenase-like Zn-dependent dehydrogenase
MKAWRTYGIGDMRLDDIPVPEVKAGWVLIKVRTLQPSITEVQQFLGTGGGGANLAKLIKEQGPLQMFGHEFCGEVVEVGEGVSNIKTGDRVFYWRRVPCYHCALCLSGHEELCCKGPLMGMDIPGCLAEYTLLPAGSLASVLPAITDAEAAAMQPLVSIVGTCHATGIEMGDAVVVIGQGSMGISVTQLSRFCGAGKTIAVDVRDDILAFSRQLGADITINASKTEPVAAVLEATGGVGADVVFECAGGSTQHGLAGTKTLSQAIRMVRDQGKITQVAILGAEATVEVSPINMRGIQYRGLGHCTGKLLQYTIELVASKRVQLTPLVTHVLPGLDKVPEAFEITGNKAKYRAINPAQVIVTR